HAAAREHGPGRRPHGSRAAGRPQQAGRRLHDRPARHGLRRGVSRRAGRGPRRRASPRARERDGAEFDRPRHDLRGRRPHAGGRHAHLLHAGGIPPAGARPGPRRRRADRGRRRGVEGRHRRRHEGARRADEALPLRPAGPRRRRHHGADQRELHHVGMVQQARSLSAALRDDAPRGGRDRGWLQLPGQADARPHLPHRVERRDRDAGHQLRADRRARDAGRLRARGRRGRRVVLGREDRAVDHLQGHLRARPPRHRHQSSSLKGRIAMKIENGMNGSSNHALAPYLLRPPRRWQGTLPPAVEGGVVQDVLGVFRRQWMTIVATIGVLVAGTVLYCLIVTPTYLGQSTVLIEGKGPQVASLQDAAEAQSPFQSSKYDYYQTQFTLLRSSLLVKRVIQELDLAHDPRFATSTPANAASSKDVPPTLVAQYLKNLVIFPVRGTRLVYIQYMSPDANLSADVANAHARLFVRIGMERLYNSMDQIRTFLQAKLGELQEHMQIAEANLAKFQSAHKMMPIDVSKDVASERLVELSRRLTTAEGE